MVENEFHDRSTGVAQRSSKKIRTDIPILVLEQSTQTKTANVFEKQLSRPSNRFYKCRNRTQRAQGQTSCNKHNHGYKVAISYQLEWCKRGGGKKTLTRVRMVTTIIFYYTAAAARRAWPHRSISRQCSISRTAGCGR